MRIWAVFCGAGDILEAGLFVLIGVKSALPLRVWPRSSSVTGANVVLEENRAQVMAEAFQADADGGKTIRDWFAALPVDQYPGLIALARRIA